MVPFSTTPGTPTGKTRWREIKVAILARLGERLTRHGQRVIRLCQRRLVAVLGTIDDLTPRLGLEAVRQGSARRCRWCGSRMAAGFLDRVPALLSGVGATAILDFYHARTTCTRAPPPGWMADSGLPAVVCQVTSPAAPWPRTAGVGRISGPRRGRATPRVRPKTLTNVYHYLKTHEAHISMTSSKPPVTDWQWLGGKRLQVAHPTTLQRVGMRWSEPGFDHLLHLRLAWVNQRLRSLLPGHDPLPQLGDAPGSHPIRAAAVRWRPLPTLRLPAS